MRYTIWCDQSDQLTYILGHDDGWYVAANNPKSFPSVKSAQLYFFSPLCKSEPVGSNIWIKGPRGGVYPMTRLYPMRRA